MFKIFFVIVLNDWQLQPMVFWLESVASVGVWEVSLFQLEFIVLRKGKKISKHEDITSQWRVFALKKIFLVQLELLLTEMWKQPLPVSPERIFSFWYDFLLPENLLVAKQIENYKKTATLFRYIFSSSEAVSPTFS